LYEHLILDGRGTGVSGTEEEYYENPFYVPADEEVSICGPGV